MGKHEKEILKSSRREDAKKENSGIVMKSAKKMRRDEVTELAITGRGH